MFYNTVTLTHVSVLFATDRVANPWNSLPKELKHTDNTLTNIIDSNAQFIDLSYSFDE